MAYTNLKIKVCGMRDHANIKAVATLLPDYMGFIFYEKSKRYVGRNYLVPELNGSIVKVGVFVNQSTKEIVELSKENGIDHLQLHGIELPTQCAELKKIGYTIIKAFSMSDDFDFNRLKVFRSVVDNFLFDTKGEGYGGTGKPFNWDVLEKYGQEVPFFLSGGISLLNAEKALRIRDMNIHALDVNSGFESEPGVKDVTKLTTLFNMRGDY
jgi:phosphoribosylanthranilate isomerase